MDHINIFKGIKGQLDSEKWIKYYISKWNRNLPSTCPSKPEPILWCHSIVILLNSTSLKSLFATCVLSSCCCCVLIQFWCLKVKICPLPQLLIEPVLQLSLIFGFSFFFLSKAVNFNDVLLGSQVFLPSTI